MPPDDAPRHSFGTWALGVPPFDSSASGRA